ncbi:hypothetical protein FQR65_LT20707 [Abscondita terminalis]|nr:hypothetical protein FQR65_LT20707 [Abscondita terminalis]
MRLAAQLPLDVVAVLLGLFAANGGITTGRLASYHGQWLTVLAPAGHNHLNWWPWICARTRFSLAATPPLDGADHASGDSQAELLVLASPFLLGKAAMAKKILRLQAVLASPELAVGRLTSRNSPPSSESVQLDQVGLADLILSRLRRVRTFVGLTDDDGSAQRPYLFWPSIDFK